MNNDQPEPAPVPKPAKPTYRQVIYDYWNGMDWTKSNMDLAGETDASYITVARWRDVITGRTNPKPPSRKHNIDWDSLDWSKNDSTLAKELKIPYSSVRQARIKLNKPFPSKDSYNRVIDKDKLEAVDWVFTKNIDIARQLGCSRERIRQLRHELQKPACLVKGLGDNNTACFKWIVQHQAELEGRTRREISELFHKEYPSILLRPEVYNVIRLTGIRISLEREKYRQNSGIEWGNVNFNLPNIVLKMIYKIPQYRLANERNRYFKAKSSWHLGGYSRLIHDERFIAELEAEKTKAIAAGYNVDSERIEAWLKWKRDYKHPDAKAKEA